MQLERETGIRSAFPEGETPSETRPASIFVSHPPHPLCPSLFPLAPAPLIRHASPPPSPPDILADHNAARIPTLLARVFLNDVTVREAWKKISCCLHASLTVANLPPPFHMSSICPPSPLSWLFCARDASCTMRMGSSRRVIKLISHCRLHHLPRTSAIRWCTQFIIAMEHAFKEARPSDVQSSRASPDDPTPGCSRCIR